MWVQGGSCCPTGSMATDSITGPATGSFDGGGMTTGSMAQGMPSMTRRPQRKKELKENKSMKKSQLRKLIREVINEQLTPDSTYTLAPGCPSNNLGSGEAFWNQTMNMGCNEILSSSWVPTNSSAVQGFNSFCNGETISSQTSAAAPTIGQMNSDQQCAFCACWKNQGSPQSNTVSGPQGKPGTGGGIKAPLSGKSKRLQRLKKLSEQISPNTPKKIVRPPRPSGPQPRYDDGSGHKRYPGKHQSEPVVGGIDLIPGCIDPYSEPNYDGSSPYVPVGSETFNPNATADCAGNPLPTVVLQMLADLDINAPNYESLSSFIWSSASNINLDYPCCQYYIGIDDD